MGRLRTWIMLALAASMLAACREPTPTPSPLGTLTPQMLDALEADCPMPLIQQRVCGRMDPAPDCQAWHRPLDLPMLYDHGDKTLVSATTRVWCQPPLGWSIWTDDHQRILGVCVDDVNWAHRDDRAARAAVARQFYLKHFPPPVASVFATRFERHEVTNPPGISSWIEGVGALLNFSDRPVKRSMPNHKLYELGYLPQVDEDSGLAKCWGARLRK